MHSMSAQPVNSLLEVLGTSMGTTFAVFHSPKTTLGFSTKAGVFSTQTLRLLCTKSVQFSASKNSHLTSLVEQHSTQSTCPIKATTSLKKLINNTYIVGGMA